MDTFSRRVVAATVALFLSLGLYQSAVAQGTNQAVIATSIAEGQVDVPQTDSITFTLSSKLGFNSLFTRKFHWEPFGKSNRLNVFLDADRLNPRFDIFHAAQQDFSVYVFGVFDTDSANVMARPFTLNYTTNSTMGDRVVSGTAALSERQAPGAPAARMVDFLNQTTNNHFVTRYADDASRQIRSEPNRDRAAKSGGSAQLAQTDINWTVVFLVENFILDERDRVVVAAAAVQEDGSYTFSHVRDGTYYPLAVTFADHFGDAIGAYGYHDPDGDFNPDPVVVSGGNIADIALDIYPYSTNPGLAFRDFAEGFAIFEQADATLLSTSTTAADSAGHAVEWTYRFYSPSADEEIFVSVDPLTVTTSIFPGNVTETTTTIPASGLVDSDAALQIAELNGGATFRDTNSAFDVFIEVTGGNLLEKRPSNPTRLLWLVQYGVVGSIDPPFEVMVDMTSGVVVGVEEELQPESDLTVNAYPNPWTDKLSLRFETSLSGTVEIEVFDLLGRVVHSGRQQHPGGVGTYGWQGSSISPGIYVVRVSNGVSIASKSVVKIR